MALVVGSAATALMQPRYRQDDLAATIAARRVAEADDAQRRDAEAEESRPAARPLTRAAPVERAALPDPSLPTVTYPPGEIGMSGQLVSVSDPGSVRPSAERRRSCRGRASGAFAGRTAAGPAPATDAGPSTSIPSRPRPIRRSHRHRGRGARHQPDRHAGRHRSPARRRDARLRAGWQQSRPLDEASARGGHELLLQVPMEPLRLSPTPRPAPTR